VKHKPQASTLRRCERHQAADGADDQSSDEGLPADPAEALDELRRRHDQDATPPGG